MNFSLCDIFYTLEKIDGADSTADLIKSAIDYLCSAKTEIENVSVKGRDAIDALLGCMLGIDMIIGKKEEDDG